MTGQVSTTDRRHCRFPVTGDEEIWIGRPFVAEEIFGRRAPLEIELGTGKARFLIQAAGSNPARDFLGVERSLSYYRVCRERISRSRITNARVLRADARTFVDGYVAEASVRAFHVYFPDPWPKKRQRKRRLLDGVFLEVLASKLEPGGVLRIATDHPGYAGDLGSLVKTVPQLKEFDWDSMPAPPPTHYEIKYRAEGRPITRFLLRRVSLP
ncbi:MAG TPA: tRNA (guanosine(46)-N7)-methyltransferase TrmB [Thermoanaerobaculia bacterium]